MTSTIILSFPPVSPHHAWITQELYLAQAQCDTAAKAAYYEQHAQDLWRFARDRRDAINAIALYMTVGRSA